MRFSKTTLARVVNSSGSGKRGVDVKKDFLDVDLNTKKMLHLFERKSQTSKWTLQTLTNAEENLRGSQRNT